MICAHPDSTFLYEATDEHGNDIAVFRCNECEKKFMEGGL